MPAEPDAIDENTDPFMGMEITSDMESDDNDNDSNHSGTGGSDDSGHSDNGAVMKYTLTHDILLDSAANSEDEDIDLEDESADSEAKDTGFEDEGIGTEEEGGLEVRLRGDGDERVAGIKYGFDGVELGFVPPPPTHRTGDQWPQ